MATVTISLEELDKLREENKKVKKEIKEIKDKMPCIKVEFEEIDIMAMQSLYSRDDVWRMRYYKGNAIERKNMAKRTIGVQFLKCEEIFEEMETENSRRWQKIMKEARDDADHWKQSSEYARDQANKRILENNERWAEKVLTLTDELNSFKKEEKYQQLEREAFMLRHELELTKICLDSAELKIDILTHDLNKKQSLRHVHRENNKTL